MPTTSRSCSHSKSGGRDCCGCDCNGDGWPNGNCGVCVCDCVGDGGFCVGGMGGVGCAWRVVGASDDHTCRPGLAYPSTPEMTVLGGLGAILSQEISRDEIYKGMIARRCYGTTGARIYLDLTANKVRMGEVSSCSGSTNIKCIVHGTAPIEYIALFNRTNELYRFYPNSKIRDKKIGD